jgi:hypothetical protein
MAERISLSERWMSLSGKTDFLSKAVFICQITWMLLTDK